MAKLSGLLKESNGILENLVFYRMYDNLYCRKTPEGYNDRKSPAQLAQRQRMQVVNDFLKPFKEIVRITYVSEAKGRTAIQAARSNIMRHALAGDYPGIHVDKSKALLSCGPLSLPLSASAAAHPEGVLIRWQNGREAAGKAANDTLVVISLFEGDNVGGFQNTGVKRSAGGYLWRLPYTLQQGTLPDVWIAFQKDEMTQMSNSLFASCYLP